MISGDQWHAWSNTTGQTTNICNHILSHHWRTYKETVLKLKLKGWEAIMAGEVPEAAGGPQRGEKEKAIFSMEGFHPTPFETEAEAEADAAREKKKR